MDMLFIIEKKIAKETGTYAKILLLLQKSTDFFTQKKSQQTSVTHIPSTSLTEAFSSNLTVSNGGAKPWMCVSITVKRSHA